MIIRDSSGEILVDSRVSGVIIDQNGNEWWLTDEGDRLSIELMDDGAHLQVSITAPAERTVTIKPEVARARVLIPKPRRRVRL